MGFLDLSWHPGECQADFGQVDVRYRGVVTRMRHFVLDFPYSNISPCQLMPGENAECTCQALRNLFEWLGGVPERIVCFASMFVRQVRQCFSAVWADGFPRCRHRFPVM